MRQWSGIKIGGRLDALNPRFPFVVIFQGVIIIIDQVTDIVTISGNTPVHPSG